jgi:hypothetical protein
MYEVVFFLSRLLDYEAIFSLSHQMPVQVIDTDCQIILP